MTPAEKAKEIYDKFKPLVSYYDRDSEEPVSYEHLNHKAAKDAALLCVDEVDAAIDFDWMQVQNLDRQHAYWSDVKNEIKKL